MRPLSEILTAWIANEAAHQGKNTRWSARDWREREAERMRQVVSTRSDDGRCSDAHLGSILEAKELPVLPKKGEQESRSCVDSKLQEPSVSGQAFA